MDDLTKQKIPHTVRGVLKSKEEGTYLVRPEHHKKQFTVVNGIRLFFFFLQLILTAVHQTWQPGQWHYMLQSLMLNTGDMRNL